MKRSSTEIKAQFERYATALLDQKKLMTEEITKWNKERIRIIDEHTVTQKKLLDQDYDSKKRFLEMTRKRFVEEVVAQEKKKDNEQLQRLRDECNALKIALVAWEYSYDTIPMIQFVAETQSAQGNQVENSTHHIDEKQSQNMSKNVGDNDPTNGAGAGGSSTVKSASSSSKPTSRQSSAIQPSSDHERSVNGDDDSMIVVNINDDISQRCPTCFMIFPAQMTSDDRNQHANEHFS